MMTVEVDEPVAAGRRSVPSWAGGLHPPGLPSTEKLLTEGGDSRIEVKGGYGLNSYGCPPLPDEDLIALGSSTASVVSAQGFDAAARLRRRLLAAGHGEPCADSYARELDRVRRELLELCGVRDVPGLEVVFGASGTDLHLIAAQLVSNAAHTPTRVIMVDAAETGSRVAAALSGCHFSSRAALGAPVMEGQRITRGRTIEIVNVAIRLADGTPRIPSEVDIEVEELVAEATAKGWRSLLILVDVSKTGLIAPSPARVVDLHHRYTDTLDVFVDGCQFRIAPATLRVYLEQGFMVALTGSKFITGPTFSGALLIPAQAARRFHSHNLPAALRNYSSRGDWPRGWSAARSLQSTANFGLLLRWEAALQELRAFRSVPEGVVSGFLQTFAGAVRDRLVGDPIFEPLLVPELDRGPLFAAPCWDRVQTIFPFLLHYPSNRGGRVLLNRNETLHVHRLLQLDLAGGRAGAMGGIAALRCQMGQPVTSGERGGVAVSALRLCASARLVVEAACGRESGAAVIERALTALDKTAYVVRSLCRPSLQPTRTSRCRVVSG